MTHMPHKKRAAGGQKSLDPGRPYQQAITVHGRTLVRRVPNIPLSKERAWTPPGRRCVICGLRCWKYRMLRVYGDTRPPEVVCEGCKPKEGRAR